MVSATGAADIPKDGIAHVALVGRSNVGKSSLINALTKRALARTSAAPGKTRLANLYRVTVEGGPGGPGRWDVYFADLPGYGYARGGPASVEELGRISEGYFRRFEGTAPSTPSLTVLHLIDARHPGLEADLEAAEWLASVDVERTVIATKVDKLSRRERAKNLKALERQLGTAALPISAASGEGLDDLWTQIARLSRRR